MLNLLSNMFLCRNIADHHIWKANPSSSFSSKSFSKELEGSLEVRLPSLLV